MKVYNCGRPVSLCSHTHLYCCVWIHIYDHTPRMSTHLARCWGIMRRKHCHPLQAGTLDLRETENIQKFSMIWPSESNHFLWIPLVDPPVSTVQSPVSSIPPGTGGKKGHEEREQEICFLEHGTRGKVKINSVSHTGGAQGAWKLKGGETFDMCVMDFIMTR